MSRYHIEMVHPGYAPFQMWQLLLSLSALILKELITGQRQSTRDELDEIR